MPTINEVAVDFTAMLRAGEFAAAGERYWAADVRSIEPHDLPDGSAAYVIGFAATRAKKIRWLAAKRIADLSIDGPFVTGNQFALFMDMMITNRVGGEASPFTEIALYTVQNGHITEERYFYD